MNIASIQQAQYRYYSPLPFSGKKKEKFNFSQEYPDIAEFNKSPKLYKPEDGRIACAPSEVQKFWSEVSPEIDSFKQLFAKLSQEEKTVGKKLISDINKLIKIAHSGEIPSNAKFEKTENGFIYKEYNGKFITREITKSPKKLKVRTPGINNTKNIIDCDIKTDPKTGQIIVTNIRYLVNYKETSLGAESYDKEYVFKESKLTRYAEDYSTDGKGNGKAKYIVNFDDKANFFYNNFKSISSEGVFVDKAICFDNKGKLHQFIKNPIKDREGIYTYEQKMEFVNGQPEAYIREGVEKNGSREYERYAKFNGTGWYFMN